MKHVLIVALIAFALFDRRLHAKPAFRAVVGPDGTEDRDEQRG